MTTIITNNLTDTVDQLGVLKARIAELETQERHLRSILIENGPGAYEGEYYRATVNESERHTLDMDAVREKLGPKWCARHENITAVTTVRIAARNGQKL